MPSKVVKSKKTEVKPASKSTAVEATAVVLAKPTIAKGNGTHDNVYDDAVKEIVALSENDAYSRKVDNGPLSEARGKDTWRLHAQLRAVDQVNVSMMKESSAIRTALSTLDDHLHTNTVAVTGLVRGTTSELESNLQSQIAKFSETVRGNFEKLAKATAGSEENLRAQTHSFSKAMEELLNTLQNNFEKQIAEFRDEATRLIDKRFNQSDVAFAAVRADQEVIKALLTDIIKDRLGRAEPRGR